MAPGHGGKFEVKQADRPDFVTAPALANGRYDSHSSRRRITPALKLPTRTLREPHHRVPIWNCTEWRLPRFTVTKYARLCGPIPRLIPWACACSFQRTAVNRHPALWSPDLPPVVHYASTGGCLACFIRIVPRRGPGRQRSWRPVVHRRQPKNTKPCRTRRGAEAAIPLK